MPFTCKDRVEMYLIYRSTNRNGAQDQSMYGERFPNKPLRSRKMFERLHEKLYEMGLFLFLQLTVGYVKTDKWLVVE